jgi:hypothetical protein
MVRVCRVFAATCCASSRCEQVGQGAIELWVTEGEAGVSDALYLNALAAQQQHRHLSQSHAQGPGRCWQDGGAVQGAYQGLGEFRGAHPPACFEGA